jgi:hypothetical protein
MATIVKRSEGTLLTNNQLDNNFGNLNTEKLERNGSIAMTGELVAPGVQATDTDGFKVYNDEGDLVATLGVESSTNVAFEGNISIGGDNASLDVGGGTLTVNNINVTGSIISTQLAKQYKVSGNGDIFTAAAAEVTDTSGTYLTLTMDVILKLVVVDGSFNIGNDVTGSLSGVTAIVTKVVDSNTLYVQLDDPNDQFIVGETITYASNTSVLSNIVDNTTFESGQKLKIFGASILGSPTAPATPAASGQQVGAGSGTQYYYNIVQYRYSDGKLSTPYSVSSSIEHRSVDEFNNENNISLTLARSSVDYGLAIYRSINVDNDSKLIAVLGPAELSNQITLISFVDYGGYAVTGWSTRDLTGAFTQESNLVHFPLTVPLQSLQGWVTAEVESKVEGTRNQVALTSSYALNTSGTVQFVHDNTDGIQLAIDDNRELGIQRFNLPNGTYYTSRLLVPSNFTISGSGQQTVLRQIPWNFDHYNDVIRQNEKGNVLSTLETLGENIFFVNLTVDGNIVNNVRYEEAASNYLVNMNGGTNINFNNVRIENSVGGGIWAYQTEYLRVQNTEIINGSLTYTGLPSAAKLSPLFSGSSRYLSINNNLFENYLNPVDVSVTYIGTVVGNTVRNCGSGLLVFGSAHLLSSPNLIMGPDNEFIPGPDRFDSDYNSINITLEQGVDFFSPSYLYQESGESIYLGSIDLVNNPGTAVDLSADIRLLTKFMNDETLKTDYSNNALSNPIIEFITENNNTAGDDRTNGYFQFKIVASNVNQVPSLSELITENAGILVENEEVMGLVYRVLATTQIYTDVDNRISIAASEFSSSGEDKFVTITLADPSKFSLFALNDVTKIYGHTSTPDIEGEVGEIVEKIAEGNLIRKLKIKLPPEVDIIGAVSGVDTGYITIRKTIIIAKGRVN